MKRVAGQRIADAAGSDASGRDVVTKLILAGATAGLGATGIMGLIDLFTGDARIDNSGEYLANSAIQSIPFGTAALGAAVASDPVSRGVMDVLMKQANLQEAASSVYVDQDRNLNRAKVGFADSAQQLKERIMQEVSKNHSDPADVMRKSGRNLARGAGIGAIAGSIPAVMLMRDAPAQQQEVI